MKRILAQTRKELTQVLRDRLALALALVLPVLLYLLQGTALSLTPTNLPVMVQDYDQSPLSRRYLDAFRSSLTFRLVPMPAGWDTERALRSDEARAVLIIPEDFGRDLQRGVPVEVQAQVDATDTNTATQVRDEREETYSLEVVFIVVVVKARQLGKVASEDQA